MRRLAGYFFALTLAFAPVLAAAQQVTGGGGGGASPGGVSGDVQTNNGSGGLNGVTVLTVPNGGTGLSAPTAHDVLVGAGSLNVVPITPGTAGWVLTSNGVGADPSFQAAAGGGCTTACAYSDTQTINMGAVVHNILVGTTTAGGTVFLVDNNGSITSGGNITTGNIFILPSGGAVQWNGNLVLGAPAPGILQVGGADSGAPGNEMISVSSVSAGTSNTAGQPEVIRGSRGTGTGLGGSVSIATAPAGTTGSAQNAASNVLTVDGNQHVNFTSAAVPAISACGTSPSAVVGSDAAGAFTTGTATPTACTLTFKIAYAVAPVCLTEDATTRSNLTSYVVSTTTIVWTTAAASSQKIYYHCFGA